MNTFLVLAFLFFEGCIVGWIIELFYRRFLSANNPERKWINPGFMVGPYLPLYGFGLTVMYLMTQLMESLLNVRAMQFVLQLIVVFVSMAIAMTILELIAGLIFIKGMGLKLWDYSKKTLNYQGIICLEFTVIWGLAGCAYYYFIDPNVVEGIYWLSEHLAFSFVIGFFFGVFIIDLCYSMQISVKIKRAAAEAGVEELSFEGLKTFVTKKRTEYKLEAKARGEKARNNGSFALAFKTAGDLKQQVLDYAAELEKYAAETKKQKKAKQKANKK